METDVVDQKLSQKCLEHCNVFNETLKKYKLDYNVVIENLTKMKEEYVVLNNDNFLKIDLENKEEKDEINFKEHPNIISEVYLLKLHELFDHKKKKPSKL